MYPPYELKIQESAQVSDGMGGVTTAWTDKGTMLGYIDLVTGTDLPTGVGDNAFIENSTHVAVIPETPSFEITDDDRLVYNGRIYDVTYVDDPVGVGHHLEIYLRYSGGGDNGQ